MTERNLRENESRETQERPKSWTPPNRLEVPSPPEGYKYHWVRKEILGEDDKMNVVTRLRQHYEPVMISDLPAGYHVQSLDDDSEGSLKGVVSSGDLILMRVPVEIAEQRNAHYEYQAKLMQQAVDNELDGQSHEHMPVSRDGTRSDEEYGNRNKEVVFQREK